MTGFKASTNVPLPEFVSQLVTNSPEAHLMTKVLHEMDNQRCGEMGGGFRRRAFAAHKLARLSEVMGSSRSRTARCI